jgi:hypothetical protein
MRGKKMWGIGKCGKCESENGVMMPGKFCDLAKSGIPQSAIRNPQSAIRNPQ